MMWFDRFETPVGQITVAADGEGIRHLLFPSNRHGPSDSVAWTRDAARLRDAREQLLEYFAGSRRTFELALRPHGTPFQHQVWATLSLIPFGETWSYAEVARRIDAPRAVRAVGAANGRNPVPIVVPCHRVIGANGTLTGFGGGVETKAALLRHEGSWGQPIDARIARPEQSVLSI